MFFSSNFFQDFILLSCGVNVRGPAVDLRRIAFTCSVLRAVWTTQQSRPFWDRPSSPAGCSLRRTSAGRLCGWTFSLVLVGSGSAPWCLALPLCEKGVGGRRGGTRWPGTALQLRWREAELPRPGAGVPEVLPREAAPVITGARTAPGRPAQMVDAQNREQIKRCLKPLSFGVVCYSEEATDRPLPRLGGRPVQEAACVTRSVPLAEPHGAGWDRSRSSRGRAPRPGPGVT